jgi:hypothetical protein
MKLSPPASSSDLEAARDIARRLHQRRRRPDRLGQEDQPGPRATPRPLPAPAPPPRPAPATPPPPRFERTPAPPSWDEPAADSPLQDGAGDPLDGFDEPAAEAEADTGEPLPAEVEEAAVFPEEMVGSPQSTPFEAMSEPYEASPSPFDVERDATEAPVDKDYGAPAPPSWDDIVETCFRLAQATGAMLVDPSGQILSARGEWPEPGPEAIAAKLVSTMERTLRDAPTRSISAPLMGRHLTAWRVPRAEGLVTAAFIGDAPVRAEARPAIDTQIRRGAGA